MPEINVISYVKEIQIGKEVEINQNEGAPFLFQAELGEGFCLS